MQAADRRRINAPAGGTTAPVFNYAGHEHILQRPTRTRNDDEHRKIFLRTGVVPSASGSAYLEIPPEIQTTTAKTLIPNASNVKITCTVHGPRPLPRNAAFSPNLLLSTHVKFAPFATRQRRGYVRDSSERDLGVHVETALRGAIIGDRWPKSACEVVITVLEGEEDGWWADGQGSGRSEGWGMMSVLAGCITVASAALVDAGIDCVDLVSGGVAASVFDPLSNTPKVVLDPSPSDHELIKAACVVGYLQARDEVTEMWMKGDVGTEVESIVDQAVKAATMARTVLVEAVRESVDLKLARGDAQVEAQNGEPAQHNGKDLKTTG